MKFLLVLLAIPLLAETCSRCHEIAATADQWRASSHRSVDCSNCHGGTFQTANVNRAVLHATGKVPEQIRLKFTQVKDVNERCGNCHKGQYADWSAGPHGATFAKIFTDEKHNNRKLLMDDCLRCHGMFFDRSIREVVTPLATKGPWNLVDPSLKNHPAIPCIACHSVHTDGVPRHKGAMKESHRPSLALYDRRAGEHVRVDDLPLPAVLEGERRVRISPDKRQALCYSCHAPLATMQAKSGDDRTPLGVHEGISCVACHSPHTQSAAASCATCHPKMSNCGLDVERMNTTFADPKSPHNVHTVKCVDCHPKGVPAKPAVRKAAL